MKHPALTVRSSMLAVAALLALPGALTQAQTIERMRVTDHDRSFQQLYNETVRMDAVMTPASQPGAVATPVAPAADPGANVGVQVAGAVLAQQAPGRKEHLTTMFLAKGYKLGDMQR